MLKFMKKLERIQIESRKKEFKLKLHTLIREKTIVDTGKKDKNGKAVLYKVDRRFTLQERKERVAKKIEKALKGKK